MKHLPPIAYIALLAVASSGDFVRAMEFTTIEDRTYPPEHHADPATQRQLVQEMRPSEADPEGNWGFASEGFQLSIRFPKSNYAVGEPINAVILLRNVSERTLSFEHSNPSVVYQFAVSKDRASAERTPLGVQKDPSFPIRISRPVGIRELPPLHQFKQDYQVDTLYEMKAPGEYVIYVTRQVPKLDGSGKTELRSGNAIIRVVAGQEQASVQTSGSASATSKVAGTPAGLQSGAKQPASGTAPSASMAQTKASANNHPGVAAPPSDSNHSSPPVVASAVPAAGATTQPQNLLFAAITAALLAFIALILWRARRRAQPGK